MISNVLALCLAVAAPTPPLVGVAAPIQTEVFHDVDASGVLFASGRTYKMAFDADGARYMPRLGRGAPTSSIIGFRVDGARAAAPVADHDRVTFDRGDFIEIYDLGVEHVEQSFVLRSPRATQELRVTLTTDVAYAGRGADGLRFDAQGRGTVIYGDATIRDARNSVTHVPVRFEAGAIVIPLPPSAADATRFPLVVDPVITTFAVDGGTDVMAEPDVEYSSTANRFQVVYTRSISAKDSDILAARYDANGAFVDSFGIDVTTASSFDPQVAASGSTFMTVWHDHDLMPLDGAIQARSCSATGSSLSARFKVSGVGNDFPDNPAIGGGGPNGTFMVTWDEINVFWNFRVMGRLVNASDNVSGAFEIDDFHDCLEAEISPTPNASGRWLVVYETKQFGVNNTDLRARQVSTSGGAFGNPVAISTFTDTFEAESTIATDGVGFFVAFARSSGSDQADIWGRRVTSSGTPVLGPLFNLSALEPGGAPAIHQLDPTLSFDGVRFALAYAEALTNTSTTSTIRAATFFATSSTIAFQEGHTLVLPATAAIDIRPRLAGCGLDQPGKHFLTWWRHSETDDDAMGALWSTLGNGGIKVLQTGCGGPGAEPTLVPIGVPALGATCGVQLVNFHGPLVAFGQPSVTSACPNTPCQYGVSGAAYVAPTSTVFKFAIGTSPALVGTQLAFQGLEFLPPAAADHSCFVDTQEFTTSDTIVFTIQ